MNATIEVQFACGHRRELDSVLPAKPRVIEQSRRCPDCSGMQYALANRCDAQINFFRFAPPAEGVQQTVYFGDVEVCGVTTPVLCLREKGHEREGKPHLVANPNTGTLQEIPL